MRSGILLVDDDMEDQFIFCDAMQTVEITEPVHIECCGTDAINYLTSLPHGQLPCVVLADLNMPRMNGTELLKRLKGSDHFKSSPVII